MNARHDLFLQESPTKTAEGGGKTLLDRESESGGRGLVGGEAAEVVFSGEKVAQKRVTPRKFWICSFFLQKVWISLRVKVLKIN